jgi:hypothetical protein
LDELPLRPPEEERPLPTPAPAVVALLAAWAGLVTLGAALVLPFLPGSRRPREELEHRVPYGLADRWLPFPVYLSVVALFLGIVVLWQMRKERRPLAAGLAAQRVQAWAGIGLAVAGIAVVYAWVGFFVAWRGRG